MPATRSMAWADSTEVPPNFITIMRSAEHPFRVHQLSIKHRRARCPAHRVVPESDELPVEHGAGTQPSDEGCHSPVTLGILARLRPVHFREVLHRELWRAGQIAFLRQRSKGLESIPQFGFAGLR